MGFLLYAVPRANQIERVVEIGYSRRYTACMLCAAVMDRLSGPSQPWCVVSVDISECDGGAG